VGDDGNERSKVVDRRDHTLTRSSKSMHPDVEPFAKDVAEKQEAFWEAQTFLTASSARFLAADPDAPSYYAISEHHTRVFGEWVAAAHALDEAVRAMHERALRAAGIPEDHQLWILARKKT
jgi:hypothetical protein